VYNRLTKGLIINNNQKNLWKTWIKSSVEILAVAKVLATAEYVMVLDKWEGADVMVAGIIIL